jgi:ribosome-associated protein
MNEKVKIIIESIERLKGEEVLVLDFEGKSSLCDYSVIVTARSDRNGKAITDEINKKLKEINVERLNMDGYDEGSWILLDYDEVMVHILLEETREYYRLEELWSYAKEVYKGN